MNFDADDVLRVEKAAPGFGGIGAAGESRDATFDHGGDDVGLGGEGARGGGVMDDDHAGGNVFGGAEKAWIGEPDLG